MPDLILIAMIALIPFERLVVVQILGASVKAVHVAAAILLVLLGIRINKDRLRGISGAEGSLVLFLVLATVSIIYADELGPGIVQLLEYVKGGLIYYLIIRYYQADPERLFRVLFIALAVLASIICISLWLAVIEMGGVNSLLREMFLIKAFESGGNPEIIRFRKSLNILTAASINHLASISFVGLLIASALKEAKNTGILRVGEGRGANVLMVIFLMVIIVTLSRSIWIAVIVFYTIQLILSRQRKRVFAGVIILISLIVLIKPAHTLVIGRLGSVTALQTDSAISERIYMVEDALKLFGEAPLLGVGVGQTRHIFYKRHGHMAVHNAYVQLLLETGMLGFTAFCVFLIMLVRDSMNVPRLFEHPWHVLALGGLVSYFIKNAAMNDYTEVEFWLLAAFFTVGSRTLANRLTNEDVRSHANG